jgi:hypothetical protein
MTDTDALSAAIHEFEAALPGWWWSVGHCSVSRDASCGPESNGPDGHLLALTLFDDGFHCDDRTGSLADALRDVTRQAIEAKRTHRASRESQ